jgi:hypothetical protein
MVLSRLGLVTCAVQAFWKRNAGPFVKGGRSYALMGLVRCRPLENTKDEDFEAFVRLSLAKDSDKLLERLICLLPKYRLDP